VVDEDKPVIHTPTEGEVEKYGHIEVKTSMEVLTAKAEDRAINFSVWEERGSPIFKLPPGYKAPDREVDPDTDWAEYRVMEEDGIQPGDKIICPHLFGWSNAVVERDGYGVLYAENEGSGFTLEYSSRRGGEYKCWVSSGSWNKKGLERLEIYRGGPGAKEEGHHPDTSPEGRAALNQAADEHLMEILDEMKPTTDTLVTCEDGIKREDDWVPDEDW